MTDDKGSQGSHVKAIIGAVGLTMVIVFSFMGGVQYQKGHQPKLSATESSQAQASTLGPRGAGGFNGPRPSTGAVTAVGSDSISVKESNGSNAAFTITSTTTISDNGQTVTAADVKVGDNVAVIADSSNATQASRILVNPNFGGGSNAAPIPN